MEVKSNQIPTIRMRWCIGLLTAYLAAIKLCHGLHNVSSSFVATRNRLFSFITHDLCDHFYFDMGTNIGIQLRKLYEPQFYPKAVVKDQFELNFGRSSRRRVCAVGFEPNIHHTATLLALERAYQAAGFPLVIFTETAISWKDEMLTFFFDLGNKDMNEWGASLVNYNASKDTMSTSNYTVHAINAGNFFHHIAMAWKRSPTSRVVAKVRIDVMFLYNVSLKFQSV